MKLLVTILCIISSSPLGWCGELVPFKITPKLEVGKSRAFALSKGARCVVKATGEGFLVLELIESGRDGDDKTSTEFCSIAWTFISANGATSGKEQAFIRYARKEIKDGDTQVTRIGGSEQITIRGVHLEWSYSTKERVFLYPDSGTEYSLIQEVEQGGAGQAPSRAESK